VLPPSQTHRKSILNNHFLCALSKSAPIAPFSNALFNKSCESSLQSRCLFPSGPKHSLSIAARSAALALPPWYQQSVNNSHFCSSMAPTIADLGSAATFSTLNATGKPRKPRVVSLLPSACELLCFIPGGEEMLVGRGHEDDYPPSILDRPILTASKVNWTTSAGEFSVGRAKCSVRCSAHRRRNFVTIGSEVIWTAIRMVPSYTQAVPKQ
jgi:hypothetical protein